MKNENKRRASLQTSANMRRLACKVVMDLALEQGLGHKRMAVAGRQRNHSLSFLESHPPSSHGTDWTLRRCCTQSITLEQESVVYDDGSAVHLTNCIRETSDGAVGTNSMPDTTAHLANRARDSTGGYWGIPDSSTKYPLTAKRRCKASHHSTEATAAIPNNSSIQRTREEANLKSQCASSSRDEPIEHVDDGLQSSMMSAPDLMEECWDDALEQAILEASDSCMYTKRTKGFCEVGREVEAMDGGAMADFQAEPSYMGKCEDVVVEDDPASSTLKNSLRYVFKQSSTEAMERRPQDSIDDLKDLKVAENNDVYQMSSHFEEGFITQKDLKEFSEEDWSGVPLKFSKQQMEVLEAVACGKSVFITGSAGTGKSFLLKYIIRILKRTLPRNSVYVTASTGIAACALKGITLHAFAGIGLGSGSGSNLARRILRSKDPLKRWKEAAVLIIDEISMIDGQLFDKLEFVAQTVRTSKKCFGGIQLIVTGDFFQLPPINPSNMQKYFAFQADCWNSCFQMQVELEHVFRQSDSVFVKMLNEIRKGFHTSETLEKLEMCYRALPDDGTGIAPTRLYPLKIDVRQENMQELIALQTSIVTFVAVDSQMDQLHRFAFSGIRLEKELQLCVGAQVMLTKNLDTKGGLVNGSKGVVTGFQSQYKTFGDGSKDEKAVKSVSHLVSPSGYWPIVRFDCRTTPIGPFREAVEDGGVEVASRVQVPLILAWALSVHKCQGMTLSKVQTDLSQAFDYGMVYVALSRVKDLDGLQLVGYDPTRIKVHPEVIAFCDRLSKESAA
ncbi:hypothetical protein GOP47_0003426 [Adiantum capillus-veneris]|uniref:ATP-dependent DNA helicase n=1 Tax=Adiantum capillus-veneris TaxID=13818 RepID=A0A9D4VCF5_ADICA|nr:hypothetical protein GOP47_0003426 [Adiantum capillus-veneris]